MQLDLRPSRLWVLTVAIAAVFFSSCQAEETEETGRKQYIEFLGFRLGEVWSGPEEKLYSHANEELIIRDFFGDRKGGTFLDVGCSTPIEFSTTYIPGKASRLVGHRNRRAPRIRPGIPASSSQNEILQLLRYRSFR